MFYVGDKKGLLTACHQNDIDIKANGTSPEVFHWWLLHYIKDNGVDFYADLAPGEQVWNYPVYRYEMEITDNGSEMNVICYIWYLDFAEPDISENVIKSNRYTYILTKSGNEITGGRWTGNSVVKPPEQLNLPLKFIQHPNIISIIKSNKRA